MNSEDQATRSNLTVLERDAKGGMVQVLRLNGRKRLRWRQMMSRILRRFIPLLCVGATMLGACGGTPAATQPTTAPALEPTAAPAAEPTAAPAAEPTTAPAQTAGDKTTVTFWFQPSEGS